MRDEEAGTAGPPRPAPREIDRFEEIVLCHLDAAHNLARWLLRDPDEAADAVQDACLRAVRHFGGFRGGDARAWLLTIVRNGCFTRLGRRAQANDRVPFEEEIHTPEDAANGPEVAFARVQDAERVRDGLAALSVEFREAIVLREIEGLSYKEIASVTGVPIGTVMSRLARARRQLADVLAATKGEPA